MKYTLIFEVRRCHRISVAKSNSLLRLCKIRKMTSANVNWRSYIVETEDKDDEYAFRYDWGCLFDYELEDFKRFINKVDGGHYYKSYDYSKIVRAGY